jgi:acetolactate synthase-1/2/3 large subunit
MNGGQALIRSLYREGVRILFGLPGAGQYEAIDAISGQPEMRYITTRHEQAVGYMADGYARASGQPGVGLVVQGPGFYNTTAALATAFAVSSPVLMITGTHHRAHDATLPDYDGLAYHRQYAKWAGRANTPGEIPGMVHEAFRQLKTGRKRPVVVEVASAALAGHGEVELLPPEKHPLPAGDAEQLAEAARILAGTRHPLIWAGGGAIQSGASLVLQALAEYLQAPVVTTRSGKGALSDRHPLSLGMAELGYRPLKEWIDRRDVILAVGTGRGFGDRLDRQRVIRIDIDPAEISRARHHTCGVAGDARLCLEKLYRLVSAMTPIRPDCADEVRALNAARFGPEEQLQPQADFMRAIRNAIPDDGILISDMNQMGYYSRNYYPVYTPGTFLTVSSHGTLGCAYPIALGAKLAQPGRAVVPVLGDGGFLYNAQEMATAVQYGIGVVGVVFNDNAYGNVLRAQMEQFNGRVIGTRLHNPDFTQLAGAFGMQGIRVESAEALERALREALDNDAPALIEVPVGMMQRRY